MLSDYAACPDFLINSFIGRGGYRERIFDTMDLNRLLAQGPFGMGGLPPSGVVAGDTPQVDNSEIIYISPLSLLKVP